tara:strand:- start:2270 stop:3121 length:852 start_codon:yes stop_codon:yes gene_type:complete
MNAENNILHHSVTIPTDGVDSTKGFTQEEVEKYNITQEELAAAGQEDPAPRTEKILGKFETQEDLQNAYQALEKKLHEPSNNQIQDTNSENPEPSSGQVSENNNTENSSEPNQENTNTENNTERTAVTEAYQALQEAGEINEEIYAKFEEAGVPKELVDRVQKLEQYKADNEMKEMSAGVEDYKGLISWAANNLSENEITTYDNIMENGTPDEMRFAIKNLDARMRAETKSPQSNLVKADAIAHSEGGYKTQAHMLADMQDPRYHSDPSFRDKVMEKSFKSKF